MRRAFFVLLAFVFALPAASQHFPIDDPVIKSMWEVGMENSQTRELAHVLMDEIGPRLAGSRELDAARDWLLDTYESWDIEARAEDYGVWQGWDQGTLHVDMVEPRVQTLEAEIKAWSPGTNGPVSGEVVAVPPGLSPEGAGEWLSTVRGKYVMISAPEEMCRASQELEEYARPETVTALAERRAAARRDWAARLVALSGSSNPWQASGMAAAKLDSAGVAGVLESRWSQGWGVNKVFATGTQRAVNIDIGCEDYGLLARLLERGSDVAIRVDATAEMLDEAPMFNTIAQFTGTEKPDEYVLLGAHLDSWHAGTGATDNGTGTITMLEAARILKAAYPNPKRTILIGHWGPEEIGLTGSSAFREDHPEVMDGMQAAFNQDNGTWRFERIEGQGFADASRFIPRWVAAMPPHMSDHIVVEMPGAQNNQGSDHTSFVCAGVPSFRLQSPYDEYRQYTWHTNRDTYDKIVFDDLAENATIAAMIAYMASEDPETMGREKAMLPPSPNGQERTWRECRPARRAMN